jgi:hypothetical protein
MHPALVFTAEYGPQIARWLFIGLRSLDGGGNLLKPVADDAIAGITTIARIGGTLAEVRDGQTVAIGLLHQHTNQLDRLGTAIDGIWGVQQSSQQMLSFLSVLSSVSLGVTALSHVTLQFQFAALRKRLDSMAADLKQIKGMIQAGHQAKITAGLNFLKNGLELSVANPSKAAGQFHHSSAALTESSAYYSHQLNDTASHPNSTYTWFVARHLIVSALGEAVAYLRSDEKLSAVRALKLAVVVLRKHALAVFARTVGTNTAEFLMPALAEGGITLETLTELFHQANLAGVTTGTSGQSTADVFEGLRSGLHRARNPLVNRRKTVERLRSAFVEATTAVEEVNRLQGLALAIERYDDYGSLCESILRQIEDLRPADDTCVAFFPTQP